MATGDAAPVLGGVRSLPTHEPYVRKWIDDKAARLGAGSAYDWRQIVERRLIPNFGARQVSTLEVDDVEGYVAALKREVRVVRRATETTEAVERKLSHRRINIILKVLRQSLDRAVAKGWLDSNPARAVEPLREERPDVDPLSLDDVKAFLGTLPGAEERRYFTLAFFTGLRPGEQMGLQWDDMDWTRKAFRVRRSTSRFGTGPTKTVGATRDVDMLPPVEVALRAQREASQLKGPWVFPSQAATPRHIANLRERLWRVTLRRAALRDRPLYQTRHTFATLMLGAGESPAWVAQQLGHATVEMVFRRYARYIPNLTRKDGSAASRWLAKEGL